MELLLAKSRTERFEEAVNELFRAGVQCCLFDKSVLFPISQLSEVVLRETGEQTSEAELRAKAVEGWFPLINGAGFDHDEEGAPLYVPSRIGLLLKLQRDGWGPDELRLVASNEEWMIDNCLAADELAYRDDDLETLICLAQDRVESFEHSRSTDMAGKPLDTTKDLSKARRELDFLLELKRTGIPDRLTALIEKAAFRARAANDVFRVTSLEMDRSKLAAGYSPFVSCESSKWSSATEEAGEDQALWRFQGGKVRWQDTIKITIAYGKSGDEPPVRVPGFLLRGDRVTPTRTLRPAEYATLWKEHDLDAYLECWARLHEEHRCLNCFSPLSSSSERKKFCGEKCRNAAKQRRFRERNPEAVEQIHKRYWESIDLE